jgi:hypothetical protein
MTNFKKNCAQLAQPISFAHAGSGLPRTLVNNPPAPSGG